MESKLEHQDTARLRSAINLFISEGNPVHFENFWYVKTTCDSFCSLCSGAILKKSVAIVLRSRHARARPVTEELRGESKSSWVLLGSMCFDANTEDDTGYDRTAEGSNQRILFYDDESGSFEKAVSAPSCKAKVDEAKPLSFLDKDGKPVTIKESIYQ